MELACFDYDIIYHPGRDNSAADTLTRAFCNAVQPDNSLRSIHEALCHPGLGVETIGMALYCTIRAVICLMLYLQHLQTHLLKRILMKSLLLTFPQPCIWKTLTKRFLTFSHNDSISQAKQA